MKMCELPNCFALHQPKPPNKCETCPVADLCKELVHRDEVLNLLNQIEKKIVSVLTKS